MEDGTYIIHVAELCKEEIEDKIPGYDKALATGKMMVHLKKDVKSLLNFCQKAYADMVLSLANKWVEVSTDYLFQASFNIKIQNPEAENGYCLYAVPIMLVDCVVNDKRKDRKRCEYCGTHSIYRDKKGRIYMKCPKCGRVGDITVFEV